MPSMFKIVSKELETEMCFEKFGQWWSMDDVPQNTLFSYAPSEYKTNGYSYTNRFS
jgi:hypothetical protein